MPLPAHLPGRTTVTAVRRVPGSLDALGVATPVETRTPIPGCVFQPVEIPTETLGSNDEIVSRWLLLAPAGTDLTGTDAIEVGGDSYEVDGDPQPWPDAAGHPHHIEIWLRRARG